MSENLVLFSSDDFVIADKPHNVPTVPLKGQSPDGTLLGMVSELYPDVMEVAGRNVWEHGAVHRLDTATGGLVVFARTQSFYDHILRIQADGLFAKRYTAKTFQSQRLKGLDIDIQRSKEVEISSYFRSFGPGGKQVRPTLDVKRADSDVLYSTLVRMMDEQLFSCTIKRGFRHQIRAHLAWIGHPIVGDPLYGETSAENEGEETLQLDCVELSFPLSDGRPFVFRK